MAKRKRAGAKRRPPKGYRSWKAYMASIRPNKGGTVARRKRRGGSRKRRRAAARINPPRRRRRAAVRATRRYRRNPGGGFSVRGLTGGIVKNLTDAVSLQAGKGLTRTLAAFVPVGGFAGYAVQLIAANVTGMLLGRFVNGNVGRLAALGGTAGVIEQLAQQMGIPLLGGGPLVLPGQSSLSGYVQPGGGPQARLNGYAGSAVNLGVSASADDAPGYLF